MVPFNHVLKPSPLISWHLQDV